MNRTKVVRRHPECPTLTVKMYSDPNDCSHTNDDSCALCDHDGYHASIFPDCPWREKSDPELSEPQCIRCGMHPKDMDEYDPILTETGMDPANYVRAYEGTYNKNNGHFWCAPCYIAIGQPLGIAP